MRKSRLLAVLGIMVPLCLLACSEQDDSPPSASVLPPAYPYPYVDVPFVQEFNHTTPEVDPAIGEIVAVILPPESFANLERPTQVTRRALVLRNENSAPLFLSVSEGEPDLIAAAVAQDKVVLASPSMLYSIQPDGRLETFPSPPGTNITGLADGGQRVYIITDQGIGWLGGAGDPSWPDHGPTVSAALETADLLLLAGENSVSAHPLPKDKGLEPALWSLGPSEGLVVGTVRALVADARLPTFLDLVVIGDQGIQGLTSLSERFPAVVKVPEFAKNRIPLASPRAAVRTSDGGFVVATAKGAYRGLDRGDGFEWRVYPFERWLPSEDVHDVATDPAIPNGPIWFATAGGLATVTAQQVTLEQKLEAFVKRIAERHDRDGAVADSHLTVRGDLTSNIPWDSDNDGGWTSYWLMGECYRWKVSGDPAAKAHFDKSLDAMLNLRDLTGTDGFVARAVIRREGCRLDDCEHPDDGEWFLSPDGKWWVKGDTSNDEVIAHIFMMGPAYDLCADGFQRQRIREHVAGIVGGIMDHNWQLVDLDGKVTTYGQFDPAYVNGLFLGGLADGGRRAAAILAGLTLAHYMTREERFLDGKRELMELYDYDEKAVHESEYPLRRGKYSGDGNELATMSWFTLLLYEQDPELRTRWQDGWHRTYANTKLQQGAWWDIVNAVVGGEPEPYLASAARWLRLAPVDMIRWNVHNSQRLDLIRPPCYYAQDGRIRSDGRILPYDERRCDRWNTDQFRIDGGMGGWVEMDGADVLAPYWMGRYYGFIRPQ